MSSRGEMPKAYEPSGIEDRLYQNWLDKGYFRGKPNPSKKPYSIVIPPPNVTGILTMGHVLNNALQDILIRWRRMRGYEVCWFPGTDHAGIATEARVDKRLREKEGKCRDDFSREDFIKKVWDWKEQYGGTIIRQLKKLGTSCDWEKERFTMDEGLSRAVRESFVRLYQKGYIHRGGRMINWCPVSKTALSDEEVEFREVKGKFYHINYPLTDGSGHVTIATTRPETMFGDSAVAVNPNDTRYKHLIGKTVHLPLTDRRIPIIADEHADPEKGTGAVKITPAHDPNDFAVGQRCKLEFINIMNSDASMNERAGELFKGLDRLKCREKAVKMLEEQGLLVKTEDIVHSVGYSQRGHVPIETVISEQWFVKMDELAKPALEAVRNGTIKFYPERWAKTYFHWMENIRDWCISRQIWWGHRIPAWYHKTTGEIYVGMEAPADAGNWRQDEDVLDTWFSSWLWPFSIMNWPEKDELQDYFYPTGDLVTGPDIIFFWVARMIMAGYEFKGREPFKNVYFTSIIRDEIGRKLSKSLGNSPDPLEVIKTYGADALRFSIIYIAPIGTDIRYSNDKCELGRNFANKLWNAARFRQMQGETSPGFKNLEGVSLKDLSPDEKWILVKLNETIVKTNSALESFLFHQAAHDIYEFVWSEFCDWFIESCKPNFAAGGERKSRALAVLDHALYSILRLLHPFMPFITEELARLLGFVPEDGTIMFESYPESLSAGVMAAAHDELLPMTEAKYSLISAGRNLRSAYDIPPGKKLNYHIRAVDAKTMDFLKSGLEGMARLLNAEKVEVTLDVYASETKGGVPSQLVGAGAIYMPLEGVIDVAAEMKKLEKQKAELTGWIKSSEAKLSNPGYLAKAPEKVVEETRLKVQDMKEKLSRVEEHIEALKKSLK
jgi:valyl-tRNA synthetase